MSISGSTLAKSKIFKSALFRQSSITGHKLASTGLLCSHFSPEKDILVLVLHRLNSLFFTSDYMLLP